MSARQDRLEGMHPDGKGKEGGANVGFERELWKTADTLRGGMDAAEYKHVVLGLIFLKYISDAFEEQHARLKPERAQGASSNSMQRTTLCAAAASA